jgi:NADH:ubiquinone oxidoreductase subunit E
MNINVCIGSSCHLKGSYTVIEKLRALIAERGLEDTVELAASFCLGKCTSDGVSVQFGDEVVAGVKPENLEEIFDAYVRKEEAAK